MSASLSSDPAARLERARIALDGLSVGDAFGQCFFSPTAWVQSTIAYRRLPASPWHFTDDTVMALGIQDVLEARGQIDRDSLAAVFARRYTQDPSRGYGGTAQDILKRIHLGMPWRQVVHDVFSGMGSMGNGGAMRVAPLGAYFADDPDRAVTEARASAEVTHGHPEGQAGAIAVAAAAAWACGQSGPARAKSRGLLEAAIARTPESETRTRLQNALALDSDYDVATAVAALGNGSGVISQDTVPFSLWCAARHLDDYPEALWTTVSGLGDRDTTCAIVGGIVACAVGREGLPREWLEAREPLR